ncbi:unnamed protein product [Coregonus sp. 'balchen']|nr:unnamed protein product [Coregonus sp. 'balchen']
MINKAQMTFPSPFDIPQYSLLPCVCLSVPPLVLQANIADYGDNQWVTCFQESAEAILGQNAAYLGQLKDSPGLRKEPGEVLSPRQCLAWPCQPPAPATALPEQAANEAAFEEIFQQANFHTFVFRNRVKLETYNVSST